jgi:hypothetical protein
MAVDRDQERIAAKHELELQRARQARGVIPYPSSRSNAYLSKEQLQDRVAHGSPLDSFTAFNTMANDVERQRNNEAKERE